jgi:hypothetical protein
MDNNRTKWFIAGILGASTGVFTTMIGGTFLQGTQQEITLVCGVLMAMCSVAVMLHQVWD